MVVFWIMRSFGAKAGFQYIADTIRLKINRLLGKRQHVPFEQLTDEQAEKMAIAFGIKNWDDREHLNQIWHKFKKNIN